MRDREDEFVGRMLGHLALTDPKAPCMGAAAQARTEHCGDRDYLAGRPSKRSAWYCCGNILEAALSHCINQAIKRSGCKPMGPKCASCQNGYSCPSKAEMYSPQAWKVLSNQDTWKDCAAFSPEMPAKALEAAMEVRRQYLSDRITQARRWEWTGEANRDGSPNISSLGAFVPNKIVVEARRCGVDSTRRRR